MSHFHNHESDRKPTRVERLTRVLGDRGWHGTRELVRRVGHTFAGAKFALVARGQPVEKERHPVKPRQWRYRLVSPRGRSAPQRFPPRCKERVPRERGDGQETG